jgi:hypothetical protein
MDREQPKRCRQPPTCQLRAVEQRGRALPADECRENHDLQLLDESFAEQRAVESAAGLRDDKGAGLCHPTWTCDSRAPEEKSP